MLATVLLKRKIVFCLFDIRRWMMVEEGEEITLGVASKR